MADHHDAAFVVIGAGMAGATAAAELSERGPVVLVEQAAAAGHHATGRSASVLSETSGHPMMCALAAASRSFLESPPDGFVEHPLLSPRGLLWVGEADDADALVALAASGARINPSVRRLDPAGVLALVPHFRAEAVAGGGVFEPDARSIDTDALLQASIRRVRGNGGLVLTTAEAVHLERRAAMWEVHAGDHVVHAPVVVNASGAWGDAVAERAGVQRIGLQPRRRTACIATLAEIDIAWPLVMDIAGRYYAEPESGGLLISPADETLSEPCDAQAEEIDVARALDRLQTATTLPLRHVRRAWAGLRTFSPDGVPVLGQDPDHPGFWWLVGQGGAGIKTAPAMASALTALVHGEPFPAEIVRRGVGEDDLSPRRFRVDTTR